MSKLPKSINGHQCVGPCYHTGTAFKHPIYMTNIQKDEPVCPTSLYTDDKGRSQITDICSKPTHDETSKSELGLLALSPNIEFNHEHFLKIYYDIYTLEDAINVIENNYYPRKTNNRILNVSLSVYGKDITILDQKMIDYIKRFMCDNISFIYKKIKGYLKTDGKTVKLTKKRKTTEDIKKIEVFEKYINKVFLNIDEVYKFTNRYIKARKGEWSNISDPLVEMLHDMAVYIENKIKKTI